MNDTERLENAIEHCKEVIERLENAIEHCKEVIERLECGDCKADHEFLLSVLQEKLQREQNPPLTIKELKQMEGEPVYLMFNNGIDNDCWGIVFIKGNIKPFVRISTVLGTVYPMGEKDNVKYYRQKPTDET